MNYFLSKPGAKATLDLLMIAGLFISIITAKSILDATWGSLHCVVSMMWYALMLVHICLHRRFVKAMVKPKVMKRNKITLLSLVMFVLMTFSIFLLISGIDRQSMHVHHTIAHVFWIVIIIHVVSKGKQFVRLFKKRS